MKRIESLLVCNNNQLRELLLSDLKSIPYIDIKLGDISRETLDEQLNRHRPEMVIINDLGERDFIDNNIQTSNPGTKFILISEKSQLPGERQEDITDIITMPFTRNRLVKSVDRAYKEILSERRQYQYQNAGIRPVNNYFFARTCHKYEMVEKKKILFVKGLKEYLIIFTEERKVITLMNFKQIKRILREDCFIRIHKSYLVNIEKVSTINNSNIIIGEHSIPIGISYKELFLDILRKMELLV